MVANGQVQDSPFSEGQVKTAVQSPVSAERAQASASTPGSKASGLQQRDSFAGESDTEADGSEMDTAIGGRWSARSKNRDEETKKIFSLPASEHLMDDFMCALQRRMLHQGRLYIFDHFVCFNSSIFGYEKNRIIPLKEVTAIRKKKNCGFPNSIEITYNGRKDFFTSFLFREDAFKLLSYAWHRSNSAYAKLFGAAENEKALKLALNKVSKNSMSMPGASPREHSGELASDVGSKSARKEKVCGSSKLAKILHRRRLSEGSNDPATQSSLESSNESQLFHTGKEPGEQEDTFDVRTEGSDSDDDDAGSGTGDAEKWQPLAMEAPAVDPAMKPVLQERFDMSVKEFHHQFLSNESQFFITWHETRGDTKVQLPEWRSHSTMGHVRELKFVTPLKQVIGPSKCLCQQTQRLRLFQGEHLVLETSQIMSEIPYGDHFKVESRWDITPEQGGKACMVATHLAIPFSKKTMWKSTIEKSTQENIKGAMQDWVAAAKRWMEPPLPIPADSPFAVRQSSDSEPDTLAGGFQEPTHMSRAQSLKVRLSSDRQPDVEGLLDRVPTEYRGDIARVLKLRRLETEQHLAKRLNSRGLGSGRISRKVSYAQLPETEQSPPVSKPMITWPRALVAVVAVALLALQVLILLRATGVSRMFGEPQVGMLRVQSLEERPGPVDLQALQGQLLDLRQRFDALQSKLDQCAIGTGAKNS